MVRITLAGDEFAGLVIDSPAASVRLLIPSDGTRQLTMPTWNGNEFLLPDGSRPIIRTFTPRRFDPGALELDLNVVIHPGGAVSTWVESAEVGSAVAVSGPGRGYTVDTEAAGFVLAGDETALPAIAQLLEAIPSAIPIQVIVEVADPAARLDLPDHANAMVRWVDLDPESAPGDALVASLVEAEITPDVNVWAAGEAAAMHRIRRHLFDDRGLERRDVTVRGYWKLRD
jgi:NADPH-dependent ferric siderophore reductase